MTHERIAPIDLSPEQFRRMGYELVDRVGALLASMGDRPVTPGDTPEVVRELLGQDGLPDGGQDPEDLMRWVSELLIQHSLYNGHPRFLGYITASPHPIGILGDILAAAINPNCGGWALSPVATEIEAQVIRWIAELVGYPTDTGGILVSGGAQANYIGFLAARHAKTPWPVRERGIQPDRGHLRVYCSADTHTWIQKAADMYGLGTDAVRWIETDSESRMSIDALRAQIDRDRAAGDHPIMVIGTAGSVGTGAVDPLSAIADVCEEHDLWFHADGAYGALAAQVAGAPDDLRAISRADSVAVDPHKWLYAPLEAGCALVRDRQVLREAFSYHPSYYRFDVADDAPTSFFEYGAQNSRGFRALKVWLGLKQIGRSGYERSISEDMELARYLYELSQTHDELQAFTCNLSIACYRYVPLGMDPTDEANRDRLNALNEEIAARMQDGGEAFVSNAIIGDVFALRGCVVNFRTTRADIEAIAELSVRLGREVWAEDG